MAPKTTRPTPEKNLDLQKLVGKLIFCGPAVDFSLLVAVGSLAAQQNEPIEKKDEDMVQLLNYCASNPDAIIRYHASDMVLHVSSNASYVSEPNARI